MIFFFCIGQFSCACKYDHEQKYAVFYGTAMKTKNVRLLIFDDITITIVNYIVRKWCLVNINNLKAAV